MQKHVYAKHPTHAAVVTAKRCNLQRSRAEQQQTEQRHQLTRDMASSSGSSDLNNPPTPSSSMSSFHIFSPLSGQNTSENRRRKTPRTRDAEKKMVTIEMDKNKLIDALVELTTCNGRPFAAVEDSGLRKIIDPILEAMKIQQGVNVTVNRRNIRHYIHEEAERLREKIKTEVQNKMICLKMDAATRMDRSLLGINIQFCDKGRMCLRNLAMQEMQERHTAGNLKTRINEALREVDIRPEQLYVITTDNGRNMVKTVELMDEDLTLQNDYVGANTSAEATVAEHDSEKEQDEGDDFDDVILAVAAEWPHLLGEETGGTDGIIGQTCAAHTLQLGVNDALKAHQDTVANGRKLAKNLRTPIAAGVLAGMGRTKPRIDVETRWNSTHDMLEDVVNLRGVSDQALGESNPQKKKQTEGLTTTEWTKIEELVAALQPAKICSKRLQSEQLTVGDFLAAWLRCKIEVKKLKSDIAVALYSAIVSRESTLLQSECIVAALFLDPRFSVYLSNEQRAKAIEHLSALYTKTDQIKGHSVGPNFDAADGNSSGEESSSEIGCSDPLEQLLQHKEKGTRGISPADPVTNIKELLRNFSKHPRLPSDTDILMFWETKKISHPELYQLATTVMAVPMTQVSVERSFSHLRFILDVLRSRLSEKEIKELLFVRLNKLFMKE